jgi:hypothetical protein
MELALGLFALAYSGLVLFVLSNAMRKLYPPRRAALTAFAVSAAVHGVTTLLLGPEHRLLALGFWGVPHLLILPLLLTAARRQPTPPGT